jgi:hypothetical protein
MSRKRQLELNMGGVARAIRSGQFSKLGFFLKNMVRALHPVMGRDSR